ncbi:transcriptional regulator [Mycolicibacterium madagascariense]|uniref:Transcriptional regulator n=1 Tax=Mycolicibacterium madagascariense TaxID=212765 RepID=A0A7I7X8W6_9MYCO|nr:helix-turn-helix domain-containing protein [Mycolicibacterium madagascariense]MCV7014171.1 helix-turn-helix transcriptional regulator [Mycolicibacterium madagascariense]BBZ25780.1 transcriptional regulator [Mycolicibacterium madagascariense]
MDSVEDIRAFLTTRRARITPEQVGLPVYGRRRVAGLRREEVATLAGVSVDYYNRLERGNLTGVSDSVLEALAAALRLDDAEHAHLYDLARSANPTPRARRIPRARVSPSMARVLAGMTETPAIIRDGRLDILAANRLGRALYDPLYSDPVRTPNFARFTFLDPRAPSFFPDWQDSAYVSVSLLRIEAGRHPRDRSLSNLVGELSTRSEDFRQLWAAHDVRYHTGTKRFDHPAVGEFTLSYDDLHLADNAGLTMSAYTAEPGSTSADALTLLATWAATLDVADTPVRIDDTAGNGER